MRSVSNNGNAYSRNTPFRGRLGTRATSSRPQPRWEEGVRMCKSLNLINEQRSAVSASSATVSISTRIREAQSYLYSFLPLPLVDPG